MSKATSAELLSTIQKCGENVRRCSEELVKTEKQFRDFQKSTAIFTEKTSQLQDTIVKSSQNAQKIVEDRDGFKDKLLDKEKECQLLYEIRGLLQEKTQLQEKSQAYERHCKLLEGMIKKMEEKIRELEEELKTKESELKCSQDQIKALQKEPTQAQEELKKKQEDMKKLQFKMEKLAHIRDIGRQQLSRHVQRAAAPTSEVIFQYTSSLLPCTK